MSEVITNRDGSMHRDVAEWTGANYARKRKIVIDVEKYINQKSVECPKCGCKFADVGSYNDHRQFCGRI